MCWGLLRRWWKWIAGIVGAIAAVIIGLIAWGEYSRRTATARDAVKVEQARRKIEELRGRRQELLEQDRRDEGAIANIDAQLEQNRQEIEEARKKADVSDEDLAAEFAALGF